MHDSVIIHQLRQIRNSINPSFLTNGFLRGFVVAKVRTSKTKGKTNTELGKLKCTNSFTNSGHSQKANRAMCTFSPLSLGLIISTEIWHQEVWIRINMVDLIYINRNWKSFKRILRIDPYRLTLKSSRKMTRSYTLRGLVNRVSRKSLPSCIFLL